jgi:hypothetical protein
VNTAGIHNRTMKNQFDPAAFLFENPLALLFFWLLFFEFYGGVAAIIAPQGRRRTFLLLTFFLGPFGVGFASVAPRYCQHLWMGLFQTTSISVDSFWFGAGPGSGIRAR